MKLFWFSTLLALVSAQEEQVPFSVSANDQLELPSRGLAKLMQLAQPINGSPDRLLEDGAAAESDNLSRYSVQFQGCHHIQQWNDDADDEDDVRILTTRLVRFRLVPYQQCHKVSPWASFTSVQALRNQLGGVDYGEYIVDMNAFVEAYLEGKEEECYYDANCSSIYGNDDDAGNGIQISDYVQCAQFDFNGNDDDGDDGGNQVYYLGPYCASQGGEIRFNLFEDDSCTTVSTCGNKYGTSSSTSRGSGCYTKQTGDVLPFTQQSIISDPCIPCSENYAELIADEAMEEPEIEYNEYDFGYSRDVCTGLYQKSGKCETHMASGQQYEGACNYIAGIQMGVDQEGFAVAVRRSLPADAAMGTMVILSTFIGMYIYYLKYLLESPLYKGDVLMAR